MAKIRPFTPYNFLQIEPERFLDKFAELSTIGTLKIHFLKNLKFIVLYGKCIVKVMIEPERHPVALFLCQFYEVKLLIKPERHPVALFLCQFYEVKLLIEPERHPVALFLCQFYEVKLLNSVFTQAGVYLNKICFTKSK